MHEIANAASSEAVSGSRQGARPTAKDFECLSPVIKRAVDLLPEQIILALEEIRLRTSIPASVLTGQTSMCCQETGGSAGAMAL